MKDKFLTLNHSTLFLCTSMYLGTGWSLVLFSFPITSKLTIDNYYLQFVPQVTAATNFFTYMTQLMIVLSIIMIIAEWRTQYRWFPITVLVSVFISTTLTILYIFPYNNAMREGITDPEILKSTLNSWMFLNKLRVGLWTIQWLSMMTYFGLKSKHSGELQ